MVGETKLRICRDEQKCAVGCGDGFSIVAWRRGWSPRSKSARYRCPRLRPIPPVYWSPVARGGTTEYSAKLSRESTARNAFGAPVAVEAAPAADAGGGSFSGTYTLESGVDEHDIVKYDGATLAIAPSRSGCCFVVDAFPLEADAAMEEPAPLESQIRLFATDPVAGTASQSGAITLPESISAEGLYLDGSSLQALLSTSWWGAFGEPFVDPLLEDQSVSLHSYDISDPPRFTQLGGELMLKGAW